VTCGPDAELFGVTDGKSVLYRSAHDGYVLAFGAWPLQVDVRFGGHVRRQLGGGEQRSARATRAPACSAAGASTRPSSPCCAPRRHIICTAHRRRPLGAERQFDTQGRLSRPAARRARGGRRCRRRRSRVDSILWAASMKRRARRAEGERAGGRDRFSLVNDTMRIRSYYSACVLDSYR
jgi:hypothetical protein